MAVHTALTLLFVMSALADWGAAGHEDRMARRFTRPTAMLVLLGLAGSLGAADTPWGRALLLAIGIALAADVVQLGTHRVAQLAGVVGSLLAAATYVVAFVRLGLDRPVHGIPAFVVAVLVWAWVGLVLVQRATRERRRLLVAPLVGSLLVLAAVFLTGWMTGLTQVGWGGTLFVLSGLVLALDRFLRSGVRHPLSVLVPYHVGQLLIVLGMLR